MKRLSNVLYNLIDNYTGETVSFSKVTTFADGTPMTDAKCDGVIYRKLGNEYFRRNFTGPVNVKWFGAKGDGVTDDTEAFDKAFKTRIKVYAPEGVYLLDHIIWSVDGLLNGPHFQGAGTSKTILKCSGNSDKFLQINGIPGIYFIKNYKFEDFSIDMALMPNEETSIGIYQIFAYGGQWDNIWVLNPPVNSCAMYVDQGVYTNVFTNCRFETNEIGKIVLQGVGTQAVTTLTFVGSSWSQMIADNCSAISLVGCIVQGFTQSPKFKLSNQYGFSVTGGDFEGGGVLYEFGDAVCQFVSIGVALVGFVGTYSEGSIFSGILMDNVYPVTNTGKPWQINNQAVNAASSLDGGVVALELNGTVTEELKHSGLTRKVIKNTSGLANAVDILMSALNGYSVFGQNQNGDTVIENGGSGKVSIKTGGKDRIGVVPTGELILNTNKQNTVGTSGGAMALPAAPVGYLRVLIEDTVYAIPYFTS